MASAPTGANPLEALHQLIVAIRQQREVTYATAAAVSWVGWEIVLTFPQEIRVVWRGRWSIAKTLYVVARYYPLVQLITTLCINTNTKVSSVRFCTNFFRFYATGPTLAVFTTEALLCIRIYALYNRSKRILALLIFLWTLNFTASVSITVLTLERIVGIPRPPGVPFPGCLSNTPPDIQRSIVAWTISLFVQLVLFALTLHKYILSIRIFLLDETGAPMNKTPTMTLLRLAWDKRRVAPLVSLFVRDGTLAFAVIFAVDILNLVFVAVINNGPFAQIGTPWLLSVNAIMTSRLFFNLGGYLHSTPQQRTSQRVSGASRANELSVVNFRAGLGTNAQTVPSQLHPSQLQHCDSAVSGSEELGTSVTMDKGKEPASKESIGQWT